MRCEKCQDKGYIEYETGVFHDGISEVAKDICDCQGWKIAEDLSKQVTELLEKVEWYEKTLERIIERCQYYDKKGWALNPDTIEEIAKLALKQS